MAGSLLVSALVALGLVQGGQSVQAELAWRGAASTSDYTELALSVSSPSHPGVAVEIVSPDLVIRASLEPNSVASVKSTMPVPTRQFNRSEVRIKSGNLPWQVLETDKLVQDRDIVVVAGNSAARVLPDLRGATYVNIAELPTIPAAYGHIRALALSGDELDQIATSQLQALLEYIGTCGRLMLVDAPSSFAQLLEQRAACGQRFFVTTGADDDPSTSFADLLQSPVVRLPDDRLLQKLLSDRRHDVKTIALFLGGFLLLYLVLSNIRQSRLAALTVSILLTAFAGAFWNNDSHRSFIAWAEAGTSDNIARFAALERISSTGRGTQVVNSDSLARSFTKIAGTDMVLNWGAGREQRYINWSPSLLQEMQLLSSGNFAIEARLRVDAGESGMTVCNKSIASTPAAYIRWQGDNYVVPALAPGEILEMNESNLTSEKPSHVQLLMSRADDGRPSILLPLSIPGNRDHEAAWLMTVETDSGGALCHA